MSDSAPPRWALALAYAVALIPALATALLQPVWSLVDESDHYDHIAQFAAGNYPKAGETFIRPQTLAIDQATDTWGYAPAGSVPPPTNQQVFDQLPSGLTRTQRDLWVQRHIWQYSKEVGQAPLYYVLAIPLFDAADHWRGPLFAVHVLRVVNALLAASVAPFALALVWRLWPGSRLAAASAVVIAATIAGPLLDHTHVTSDTLGFVLSTGALLISIGPAGAGSPGRRRAALAGFVLGLACLTRLNATLVFPACALAFAVRNKPRQGLMTSAVVGVTAALTVSPWLLVNLQHFGSVTQLLGGYRWWPYPPPPNDPVYWGLSTIYLAGSYFAGEPFGVLPGTFWIAATGLLMSVFAIAGTVRIARAKVLGAQRRVLLVLATAVVPPLIAAAAYPALAGTQVSAPGRYAYVALPAAVALLGAGVAVELRRSLPVLASVGVVAVISLAALGMYFAQPAPGPYGPGRPDTADFTPIAADGAFGTLAVSLTHCASDGNGNIWIEMRVQNSGSAPIEWAPAPSVSRGGRLLATADYSRSTQFPATLAAGQIVAGWLLLGPSAKLGGADPVAIVFHDVAENGYRAIGDLSLVAQLC